MLEIMFLSGALVAVSVDLVNIRLGVLAYLFC